MGKARNIADLLNSSGKIDSADIDSSAQFYQFKNRIINGDCRIDQRNAGASVTPVLGTFIVDRWAYLATQTSKVTAQQNAGSVTPPVGFTNYVGITSSSSYSVLTGDTFGVYHRIEGFNIADLGWGTANAQPITLGFWVRSSLTGTFGGALVNSAENRSYIFSYTISAANTWQFKTVTIAGDTSGTWLTNNGIGITIRFGLGSGSTFSGTAGSWGAGNLVQPTGSVSVVGTNGATFYITGVQLEKGSTATSFDYRPYGTELALCQRYYQQYYGPGSGTVMLARNNAGGANQGPALNIFHKVPMRATPTGTIVGTWTVVNCAQPIFASGNNETATIYQNSTGSGDCYFMPVATTSGWTLSAEL